MCLHVAFRALLQTADRHSRHYDLAPSGEQTPVVASCISFITECDEFHGHIIDPHLLRMTGFCSFPAATWLSCTFEVQIHSLQLCRHYKLCFASLKTWFDPRSRSLHDDSRRVISDVCTYVTLLWALWDFQLSVMYTLIGARIHFSTKCLSLSALTVYDTWRG